MQLIFIAANLGHDNKIEQFFLLLFILEGITTDMERL